MKITGLDFYLDGGTAQVTTDKGTFYVDRRLMTGNHEIYTAYPDEKGSKQVTAAFKQEFLTALEEMGSHSEEMGSHSVYGSDCVSILIRDIRNGDPSIERERQENEQWNNLDPVIKRRVEAGRKMRANK